MKVTKLLDATQARWRLLPSLTIVAAVGEPPLMLAISAFLALSDALASIADYAIYPALDAPATPERVLMAVERIKRRAKR